MSRMFTSTKGFRKDSPKFAIVAVIDRCDARCQMCNIWRDGRPGEVDASFFKRLPESLKSMNLTGGEPFLRKDLPQVIRFINERCHGPRIIISTNGFRVEAIKQQMEAIQKISNKVGVRISLDGIGDMHDKIRGVPRAFQKCLETIKVLKSIPIRDLGVSFTIVANQNINNVSEISKVYKLSKELGIEFTITAAANSEFYFKMNTNKPIEASKELISQLEYVISDELKTFSPKHLIRAYYTKGLYDYIRGKRVLSNCGAGSSFFFLTAHGLIYPCQLLNKLFGDLKSDSFDVLWDYNKADEIRCVTANCPHKCWMTCTVGEYFRSHALQIAWWIFMNKIKAHMGMKVL